LYAVAINFRVFSALTFYFTASDHPFPEPVIIAPATSGNTK
jgi:hypothetical protein